jgi:hypothetical protein
VKSVNFNPQEVQKKIRIASDLFDLAVKIKTHQIKLKNPDLNDVDVRRLVVESIDRGSR